MALRWFTDGGEPAKSLLEIAKRNGLESHAWLTDVLTRLSFWPEEGLLELLPFPAYCFAGPE